MAPKGGEIAVTIEPQESRDLREALFYACVKGDCPLLHMSASGVSLESIFLELTSDKEPSSTNNPGSEDNEKGGERA
jgi:ABC-2 type transport system ATP-binding protein